MTPRSLTAEVENLLATADSVGASEPTDARIAAWGLTSHLALLSPAELVQEVPSLRSILFSGGAAAELVPTEPTWLVNRPDLALLDGLSPSDLHGRRAVVEAMCRLADAVEAHFGPDLVDVEGLRDFRDEMSGQLSLSPTLEPRVLMVHGIAQEKFAHAELEGTWHRLLSAAMSKVEGWESETVERRSALAWYADLQSRGDVPRQEAARLVGSLFSETSRTGSVGLPILARLFVDVGLSAHAARDIRAQMGRWPLVRVAAHEVGPRRRLPSRADAGRIVSLLSRGATKGVLQLLREVDRFLHDPKFRESVRQRVDEARGGVTPSVVIGHSLGSVVAMDHVLRHGRSVDTLVTLGSPLWIVPVLEKLLAWHAGGRTVSISRWVNLYDSRDPVAGGRGLDPTWGPSVVSDVRVANPDRRLHHGIAGYLNDARVADAVLGRDPPSTGVV